MGLRTKKYSNAGRTGGREPNASPVQTGEPDYENCFPSSQRSENFGYAERIESVSPGTAGKDSGGRRRAL